MSATQAASGKIATRIRILYAAASVADGEFVRSEAQSESNPLSIAGATTTQEALKCLEVFGPFDAMLVDPVLADGASTSLIAQVRKRQPGIGIVACVASDSEDLVRPAIEAGADDWLPKRRDSLHRLYDVASRAIERRKKPSATPGPDPVGEATPAPVSRLGVAEGDRAERSRLEATIAAREAEIATLRDDVDRLRNEYESERTGLTEALAGQRNTTTALTSELESLRETQAALAAREAEIATLRHDMGRQRSHYDAERSELTEAMERQRWEMAAQANQLDSLREGHSAVAAREAEIAALRDDLDRQRSQSDLERAELTDALAGQRLEAAALASELDALRETYAELKSNGEDRAADLADREYLSAALAEREAEAGRLALALEEQNAEQARLTADLVSLRAAYQVMHREAEPRSRDATPSQERAQIHARVETGRLVLAVSEDLMSVLEAIEQAQSGMSAALADGDHGGAAAALEKSMQQARALSLMLRAYSRREINLARVLDLNEHVDAMRPMLTRLLDEDVQLDVELAPALDPVAIHPIDLEAALVSATVAVRTHLPAGGRMTITTSQARTAAGPRSASQPGAVLIAVTAAAWRRDISIPELSSDPWLSERQASSPDLSSLAGLLRSYGGSLETDASPDRLLIALSLPGVAKLSILETIHQLSDDSTR